MKDRPLETVWFVTWFENSSTGLGPRYTRLYAEWPSHLPNAPKEPDGSQRTSSLQDPSYVEWNYDDEYHRWWVYSAVRKEIL